MIGLNLMITTNQKSVIDTHTKKRERSKCNTKKNNQVTRKESQGRKYNSNNKKQNQPQSN